MNAFQWVQHLGVWAQQHQTLFLWVIGGGMAVMVVMNALWRRRGLQLTSHGSARWATPREVAHGGFSTQHGVVVGQVAGMIYCDDGPTHVALFGPTRSRKGVCHIKPTLRWFWRKGSALITDPKNGENYLATVAERRQYGRVAAFAPYGPPQCCLNVGDTIRWGDPREFDDALTVGQSLTAPRKMAKESEVSLHFRELAAMLLAAVQLHVGYTSGGCSLPLVWRFLTQRKSKTRGRKLLETLDLMGKTAHVPQGVHMAIVTITNAIETISGDRELGSIWSTAIRPFILYNSPYVAASTETSTLDLRDLQHGPEPISLYLLAPSPAAVKRLYPVYRVIIDVALTRLMEREGQGKPEDYAHRLLLCGDEWPAYGYVPTVDAEVSTIAGYGIKGWFIAQDIPQFEETYGVDSALWGNTHCKIFHAPDNDTTAQRISEHFLGDSTVEYAVLSRGKGGNSMTPHRVSRKLMTTDEVQMMAPQLGIGHISGKGLRPFLFEKVGYDPYYKEGHTTVA
jgi:type IV secretion system protein VirD4